ncbi:MAG: hypothetical protein AB7U62_16265 [Pseudolabrys sp.]
MMMPAHSITMMIMPRMAVLRRCAISFGNCKMWSFIATLHH